MLLRKYCIAISIIFCFAIQGARGQGTEFERLKLIEPEKLQADFDQVIAIMQQHPARTIFTSEDEWKEIITTQRGRLTSPMSVAQFFDVCAQVVHRIRCGHTGLNLPEKFFDKGDQPIFPLLVSIINDSLIVRQEEYPFELGTSITRINGKPFSEILGRLKTYISADGFNTTWTIRRLNQSLNNFLSVYFNFPIEYEIGFLDLNDGKEKIVKRAAAPSAMVNRHSTPPEPLTYALLKESSTALIGIHSFNYYRKDSVKFFRAVNDFFAKAQADRVDNIILDVRGNSGGDPFCAVHLLSYLEKKPFVYYGETYEWCPNLSRPITPKARRFNGDLYVLIDGLCFSTTGHLLSVMKKDNVGVMIGEESGGTYSCNDSGRWFELKYSKLKLRMARASFKTVADELPRDKGIQPDHEIKGASMDLVNGKDTVLNYTIDLIAKKNE
jgi:hypothetical protein